MSHAPAIRLGVSAAVLCTLALPGCLGVETTQEKSARLAKENKGLLKADTGLDVGKTNTSVKVIAKAVVQDPTGVAAVVRVKNNGPTQTGVPVLVTVLGKNGKKLYANNIPGLDDSLTKIPVLQRGETFTWINNQIRVTGKARTLKVTIGTGKTAPKGATGPKTTLSALALNRDAEGAFVEGKARNTTSTIQKRLTIFCIAQSGTTIKAAGRSVIEKMPPKSAVKPTRFNAFFIGKPAGARVQCQAPPVILNGGSA